MKSYGALRLSENRQLWIIDADPHVHMRAKHIFGKISKQQAGKLVLSHSPETCRDLEWFLSRYPLQLSADDGRVLRANATEHRDVIARLEDLIDPNYAPPSFDLALPPRTYQAREAAVYLANGSLLIGDDVGLGKTAAAICSFTDPRTLPAVVVTLAHLPKQWEEEIHKFAPELRVHVATRATPYELPKYFGRGPDVVVLNYHKLAGWSKVLGAYAKSIVFDEVQELRHTGTSRYGAAEYVCQQVQFRLGLSATPIYNYGGEIFSILNLLKPGCLGTHREFVTEWCGGEGGDPRKTSLKNPKAFGAWSREQFLLIRHTRKDVGRELPDVVRIPQRIDTDAAALDRVANTASELAQIILQQGEAIKGQKWQASEQLSTLLRQATGVAKAPYVADFVRLLVESGERVVLCGWHREVYDIWLSKLHDLKPRLYTGTESATQKEEAKQAFMKGDASILILSLRSGAGMNGLQEVSSCIVFGELDWSPGVHEQCIGRLNRDGQPNPVVAYFLVSTDGADPAIAEVLGLKRQQVEGIRNPTQDFLEQLDTSGEHVKRLATSYLKQIRQPIRDVVDRIEVPQSVTTHTTMEAEWKAP